MSIVDDYARSVATGGAPAGKYHRLAGVRHLKDRAREGTPAFPFVFRADLADRFFRFAEKLRHYKGEWGPQKGQLGQRIVLQPYQKFRLGSLFGWVHGGTGLRRFRHSFNLVPRKNGKSLEAAVVSLYMTFLDGEPGADGFCAATKRDQAKLVFNDAKKLVEHSDLKSRIGVRVANLHHDASASKLEPLGADSDSTDGLNPHFICIDEYQAHKNRDLIDVLETATGARRQPLIFKIGTAGDDPVSPCGDEFDYACKILEGVLVDENYFCFIASADPGDDWQDEKTWEKANPNWNVSIKPDDMRSLAAKAIGIPSAAATFQQKRLNLWVNASAPCLSVDGWRKGQTTYPTKAARDLQWRSELEHESCYVGLDLASKIDLAALSFVFPPTVGRPKWRLLQYLWTPEDTLKDRAHRDRAPYLTWVEQGWLRTCPGTRIDHQMIRAVLLEERQHFDIERIGFDPWHVDQLINDLKADGFEEDRLLEVPQTFQGMSSACLRMQADILAGDVDAGGDPVTAWSVSNVVDQRDGKDNLMFVKKKSRGRIDPVIAATIGIALQLREPAKVDTSVLAEWL